MSIMQITFHVILEYKKLISKIYNFYLHKEVRSHQKYDAKLSNLIKPILLVVIVNLWH